MGGVEAGCGDELGIVGRVDAAEWAGRVLYEVGEVL